MDEPLKEGADVEDLVAALEDLPDALADKLTRAMLNAVQVAAKALPKPSVQVSTPPAPAPVVNVPDINLSPIIQTGTEGRVQVVRILERDANQNLKEFEIRTK